MFVNEPPTHMSTPEHQVTYQHPHGYSDLTKGLGLLCFPHDLGKQTIGYLQYGGMDPERFGSWKCWEGPTEWRVTIPDGTQLLFNGLVRLLQTDDKLPQPARNRIGFILHEVRDGISNASTMHPDVGRLEELKSRMTMSLQELDNIGVDASNG